MIENPVINSPFEEPRRHFVFDENGITDEIADARRRSSYFIPIPRPKKRGAQATFASEWNAERIQENIFIKNARQRVTAWREFGHVGITAVTRELLDYWRDPDRERRLFFCQIEGPGDGHLLPLGGGRRPSPVLDVPSASKRPGPVGRAAASRPPREQQTAKSPRRRITDPAILEKRRAALAKARQVLAKKRAATIKAF